MDQFDIFKALNIDIPQVPLKENKEGKKRPAKKKTQQQTGSYSLPLTVYTGYYEPLELSDPYKAELNKQELDEKISGAFPEYTGCLYEYDRTANQIYAYFNPNVIITKGEICVTPNTRMLIGDHAFDLSNVLSNESCNVPLTNLSDIVTNEISLLKGEQLAFYHISSAEIIVPAFPEKDIPKSATFPLKILLPGRGVLEVTKKMYEESGTSSEILNPTGLLKIINDKWPELEKGCGICFIKNVVFVFPKFSAMRQEKKDVDLIPVCGTSISLVFTKIALSPDMFGGAEKVSKDDIINLLSRDFPEYARSRTEIIYDPQNSLIIPVLKGSKKGSGLLPTLTDSLQMQIYEAQYRPYYKLENGIAVRVENTPIARFQKEGENVTFLYHLPKIPADLYFTCLEFFIQTMDSENTEAMMQLFFNPRARRYFLHTPKQEATYTQVRIKRNWKMERENYLVMDIHSHGRINCSFSHTDDEDEKETRFFCVFYDLTEPKCDIRCGCAGSFVSVNTELLFDF